jgi:hypothetical protein
MIEHVLHEIGGIGLFGIISVCLFFAFFTAMLAWAAFLKKPYLQAMQRLPLDGGEAARTETSDSRTDHE